MLYWVIVAAVIICVLVIWLSLSYVRKAFNLIDETLDNILDKRPLEPLSKLGDDRISKLRYKAYRIMDMYVADAATATIEKQTIQCFISDMSHQMKTPLSGISMYSELLLTQVTDEDRADFALRIKVLTDKLRWMMECLIKMSRLEVGAVELFPDDLGIKKTIGTAVESVISSAARKNINISLLPFEDVLLYHDRKWTAEVIANVLENAVKYSPEGGEITIGLEPLSLYTKIMITDSGIGIDKEEFNLIFKRFYRGKNTSDYEGAGLGLYLARLIMEKQSGYIMVDSVLGQSTTFSLFLQNCKK